MHLITGFVLSTLLGRKKRGRRAVLPSFPGILEAVHALPGRVRFRVAPLVGHNDRARVLQDQLRQLHGVQAADANARTGSVLVRFDTQQLAPELVMAAVIRLLGLDERIARAPRSRVGHEVQEMGAALNRALHAQTNGIIDLWTAVPLVLVALGVRNVATGKGQVGWPLLWWAYLALFPPGQMQNS